MTLRRWITCAFALLLLFAQQQALLHPYQHTAEWQGSTTGDKKAPFNPESCSKCVSLADLGSAIGAHVHAFQALPASFEQPAFFLPGRVAAIFLSYHSRAPPDLA